MKGSKNSKSAKVKFNYPYFQIFSRLYVPPQTKSEESNLIIQAYYNEHLSRKAIFDIFKIKKGVIASNLTYYKKTGLIRQSHHQFNKECRKFKRSELDKISKYIKENQENDLTVSKVIQKFSNITEPKKTITKEGMRKIMKNRLGFPYKKYARKTEDLFKKKNSLLFHIFY